MLFLPFDKEQKINEKTVLFGNSPYIRKILVKLTEMSSDIVRKKYCASQGNSYRAFRPMM